MSPRDMDIPLDEPIAGEKRWGESVPYVESEDEIFLKTIIPCRKFTKLYLGEDT